MQGLGIRVQGLRVWVVDLRIWGVGVDSSYILSLFRSFCPAFGK